MDQVLAIAEAGVPTIPFFAAYLLSFEYLKPLAVVLGDTLSPSGKYFAYCNNIDLLTTGECRVLGYFPPADRLRS